MNTKASSSLFVIAFALSLAPAMLAAESAPSNSQSPQLISAVAPEYPYLTRRSETPAEVTVACTINAQGAVTRAAVVKSSNIEFNAASLEAIKKWTFTPAMKDGKAVETRLLQTFTFNVQDAPAVSNSSMLAKK